MVGEEGKSVIRKFNGTYFEYWKVHIEDYLYEKKLHQPFIWELPNTNNMDDDQLMGPAWSVAHNIVNEKTMASLMVVFSSMYDKPLAINKVHLMKNLFNLKMAEDSLVAQHLNEFSTITN